MWALTPCLPDPVPPLMKRAAHWLAGGKAYEVRPQDIALDMRRMPAIPKSRFEITVQQGR